MAREAGRYVYLADFSLAILAAFGVETLLAGNYSKDAWNGLSRILKWVAVACAAALAVPALFLKPELNVWAAFSLLMILLSYGLFQWIVRGHSGTVAQLLIAGLILFDLSAFNWAPKNRVQPSPPPTNHLDRLLSCHDAAAFLKSRPGPFRVQIPGAPQPNIGDLFGAPILGGTGATLMKDPAAFLSRVDLLNARYILRPASAGEPGPIYQDASWKVYEDPAAIGAAWVVHETVVEPSPQGVLNRLGAIDPRRRAFVEAPLKTALEPYVEAGGEPVAFRLYSPNRMELSVRAQSRGLLVLSEFYYPGWRAKLNGREERIYKVDGVLRGIVVPRGESRVVLEYVPATVYAGGAAAVLAFLFVGAGWGLHWKNQKRRRRSPSDEASLYRVEPIPAQNND
jgi:uncharacterized membrane protein